MATLSNQQLSTVQSALSMLLDIVGSSDFDNVKEGETGKAIDGDVSNINVIKEIMVRSVLALENTKGEAERAILISFKTGVDAVAHKARLIAIETYREISKLSPATRAMLGDKGKEPTSTTIKLSDVSHLFPSGMSPSEGTKLLHRVGYKLGQGNHKDASERPIVVNIGKDVLARHLAESTETTNA